MSDWINLIIALGITPVKTYGDMIRTIKTFIPLSYIYLAICADNNTMFYNRIEKYNEFNPNF